MYYLKETNVIISGWISSGTTITALMLAYLLNKKFVYAGGTFKFIAEELGYDPKGNNMVEYEKIYGEKWDYLWENYVAWKIKSERNLLANTKIGGFFTEKAPWLFEAFITADADTRQKRAGGDQRTEDIEKRDWELNDRWKKLFDIEFMNPDEIRENHDYLIKNDNLSIAETVFQIFNVMREALGLRERLLFSDIQKLERIALEKGKDFFYAKLNEKGLLINYPEVFKDWTENFDQELSDTKKEWREVVIKNCA